MAEQGRTTLKGYFETGDKPTQAQFEDLIDSVPNTSDSGVSNTEFGYLGGVTSAIQTQIDAKQNELTGLTATVTELNYTDGVTSAIQTQIDSKQDELTGLTASVTELNYTNGVTSAIQTQIDSKQDELTGLTASVTELNYTDGVTSAIQTQLDAKIASVQADTTPQLGGDLDVNGNDITGNPAIDGRRAIVTEAETAKTLALTDAGDFVVTTSGSATIVYIPANASVSFPIGTEIDFIQKGAGELTIEGRTGVTLNGVSAGSTAITAQWGGATIKKIDADEWVIVGKINDVA